MFLPSIVILVLATVLEGTVLTRIGVLIHLVFFGHQNVHFANRLPHIRRQMYVGKPIRGASPKYTPGTPTFSQASELEVLDEAFTVGIGLSLATNTVSTSLICYIYW